MADHPVTGRREPILQYEDLVRHESRYEQLTMLERGILEKVNRKLGAAVSLNQVLQILFMWFRSIYPCERIGLAFVEEEGRRIVSRNVVACYEPIRLDQGFAQDIQDSSLREVIERGSLRIISDLPAYLESHPDSEATRLIVQEGIRSSMTCPLTVDGRNAGLLFWSSRRPDAFGDQQVLLHLAVAERLGQVVEKAYRIDQLEAASEAYLQLMGFVSHELKSPLASLASDAMLLAGGFLGELAEPQRRKIERIIAKSSYLLGLVREYLDLARIEDRGLRPQFQTSADFEQAVIRPALEIVHEEIEEQAMRLQLELPERPLAVECDADLFKIVLINLLTNAVKYGRPAGEIRIAVVREKDGLRLTVRNEGPGFPESERSRLFRRFSRLNLPELRKQKGTGVGLYTCWRIVQLHNGRISASSRPGEWAEFVVWLPQPVVAAGPTP